MRERRREEVRERRREEVRERRWQSGGGRQEGGGATIWLIYLCKT